MTASTSSLNFAAIRVHSNDATSAIAESLTDALHHSGASDELIAEFTNCFKNRKVVTRRREGVVETTDRTEIYLTRELADRFVALCPPGTRVTEKSGEYSWTYPDITNEFYEKYNLSLYEIEAPAWTRFNPTKTVTYEKDGEQVTDVKEFTSDTLVVSLPSGDSDEAVLHRKSIAQSLKTFLPRVKESLGLLQGAIKMEIPRNKSDQISTQSLRLTFADSLSLEMREFIYWILSNRAVVVTAAEDEEYLINYSVRWAYKPRPRTSKPIRR